MLAPRKELVLFPGGGACRRGPPGTTGNKPLRGCSRRWNSRSPERSGRHIVRATCGTPGCSGWSAKLSTFPAAFHGSVPEWTTVEKVIRPSVPSSSAWFPGPRSSVR